MANPLFEPKDWRALGGTARWRIGPYTAFGKGIPEDKNGNKLYHLLEIDRIDHSPVYGDIDVYSEYEKQFEDINKDITGNPDYPNKLDKISDFVHEVIAEPLYVYVQGTALTELYTKFGPIIVGGSYDISLYVRDKDGNLKGTLDYYTLENYDALNKDRLSDGLTNVLNSTKIIIDAYEPYVTLEAGDIVFADYAYFHHTDMLRDEKQYSVFSSPQGKTTVTLTVDLTPTGDVSALQDVNNVEIVTPDFPIPIGAEEYILQVGIPDTQGNVNFKVLSTGKLPLKTSGRSTVISFDRMRIKYLKLILLGAPTGAFIEIDTHLKDISTYNYDNVTIVPYYVDTTVEDIQGSMITGSVISVAETDTFEDDAYSSIGKLFIPQYNIYDVETRQHYVLSHFDLRYGTDIVYQGIPSSFLVSESYFLNGNIGDIAVSEPYPAGNIDADVYLPFTYDLISRNYDTGELYFKALFKNIDEDTFELYSKELGQPEALLTKDTDYTINGVTGQISLIRGDGLRVGERLSAKYKRNVIRNSQVSTDSLHYIASRDKLASIVLSEMKIFPSVYFADFVPNDETEIYEFDVNPAEQSDSIVSNKQLVKLLGGNYVKQTFGPKKRRMSISGERISDEMFTKLQEYEQRTEALGLVTDTFEFRKVAIVPDSLKGTRRRTTAVDYDEATTTWSYSMEIQEL